MESEMTHHETIDDNIQKIDISRKFHREIAGEKRSLMYRYEYYMGRETFFVRKRIGVLGRIAMIIASMGMLDGAKSIAENVDSAFSGQDAIDVDYDIEAVKRVILLNYEMQWKA